MKEDQYYYFIVTFCAILCDCGINVTIPIYYFTYLYVLYMTVGKMLAVNHSTPCFSTVNYAKM